MTEPRDDGRLDVPVAPLAGGRGQRRRAAAALLSITLVVGGAFGLARLATDGRAAPGEASQGPRAALRSVIASPDPAGPGATRRSNTPRVERLLDIPDRALVGAPHLLLVEQDGLDLRLQEWTPGADVADMRTIPRVVTESDSGLFPVPAPAGDRVLLLVLNAAASATGGTGGTVGTGVGQARLIDRTGRVLWTGSDIAVQSGAVWSADGRSVAVAGTGRRWHLVSIGADGKATDRVVRLPGDVFLPSPLPIGSISIPRIDPRTIPLGFSANGRWIYGAVVSAELGILIGQFRVSVRGPSVEPVHGFGLGGSDAIVTQPGTIGGRLIDPVAGRIANWRVNANTAGGPPTLEVRNADNGFAFVVDAATPLGSGWGNDGGLYVLAADTLLFPSRVTLERVAPDGAAGSPIVETGPVTSAGLIAIGSGYAVLVVSVTRPSNATQIVLVDLADPARVTALDLPTNTSSSILAAELRP